VIAPAQHDAMVPTPMVYVANDDAAVRCSLEQLGQCAGWRVEAFRSASEFLSHPATPVPACVVLDVALPGGNGLDVQQRLAGRPELPVIFATGCGDVRTAVSAMKAGAVEFFTTPVAEGVLLAAVCDAIERSRAVLASQTQLESLRARYAALSAREREVMALVVRGRLNKQAAAELGISEITVKAHRGKMMRKMAARSVPELVTMAARLFPAG
jgi:FixJ family two-component response regulator